MLLLRLQPIFLLNMVFFHLLLIKIMSISTIGCHLYPSTVMYKQKVLSFMQVEMLELSKYRMAKAKECLADA
jgi:hypothetical protein